MFMQLLVYPTGGWIVWWTHSTSEMEILIKYLDSVKTKVIWDIN